MELDDQFQAAVKVIQGLPINGEARSILVSAIHISKNYAHFLFILGPYQPSNDMKLKFYGYYKQATQGQCNQTKPSFWDVVGRAKWSAWNSCENMTKDEAKQLYIDEIKKVILKAGINICGRCLSYVSCHPISIDAFLIFFLPLHACVLCFGFII